MGKSIFLCGFMGSGKSTAGKKLASRLSATFIDLDTYIIAKTGKNIPKIFEEDGEAFFRQLEINCLTESICSDNTVIATGGGTLLNPIAAKIARENGIVVFIDTRFERCYSRIKNDTNRPLVQSNTKEQLKALYNKRRPTYIKISHIIIKDSNNINEILKRCII